MEMAGYKTSLLKTIRIRQLQFFGHIRRAGGLEKQILSGKLARFEVPKAEEDNAHNKQAV